MPIAATAISATTTMYSVIPCPDWRRFMAVSSVLSCRAERAATEIYRQAHRTSPLHATTRPAGGRRRSSIERSTPGADAGPYLAIEEALEGLGFRGASACGIGFPASFWAT